MLKALPLLLLTIFASVNLHAQTIIYNGCAESDVPQNLTLTKDPSTTTDASISRNIYFADIMPGGQPGYLVVSWSTVRHQWEIFFNIEKGLSPDGPVIRLYYHSSSGAPRPPAIGWTIEGEEGGGCTTPATLTGDVLPVQLLTFGAEKMQTETLFKWSTAREINFSRFELERSSTGINFISIAKIIPNSAGSNNYSVSDGIAKTVAYYRLKMIDKDETFTYSNVLTIQPEKQTIVTVYPNPAVNHIQVSVPSVAKGKLVLQVINLSGQIVSSSTYNNNGNASSILLDVTGLKKSSYLLRVTGNSYSESVRFVKN